MKRKKIRLRKKWIIVIILLTLSLGIIGKGFYLEPYSLKIKEYKISSKKLPLHFHGLKIVHLTDIHYGTTVKLKQLKTIVNNINLINPDIVVFTGDLIDKTTPFMATTEKEITTELKKIKATLGKYAIYGEHDYFCVSYTDILAESNFILLNNTYDLIFHNEYEPIFIGGINTFSKLDITSNIQQTISDFNKVDNEDDNIIKPRYFIILMHMPDYTNLLLDNYQVDLILAGHSHNGQIKIPFKGGVLLPAGSKRYYQPYYQINRTDLYISPGLGTTRLKVRFLNKPSFNLYRLTTIK
ncbi:MAG: metallophosphoesterase [Bacilli bacterium]|jgi:predicted MPP superfamily phosphohydrolase|nr:metallophosphoesterase [Bacilli bacterium]